MDRIRDTWRTWLVGSLLAAVTLAAYWPARHFDFLNWDDLTYVSKNDHVRGGLTWNGFFWSFTHVYCSNWHPLTWLSHMLDCQLYGLNPGGHHLTSLLLHSVNASLLFVALKRLTGALWRSALVAALFALHPLHVESVAWVTERKDVLFVFFYLLGLISYFRWLDSHKRIDYGVCFGLFAASALSKSTAVTFPVVLLLIDHFLAKRKAWGEKVPFFAVSLIIAGITFVCQAGGPGETVAPPEIIPLWARAGLVGYCSLFYVRKFLWPAHLSAVYPTFDEMHWNISLNLEYLAAFALVTVLVFATRRRWPMLLPSWLFYIITLSPTIGLVPVGIHVVADRYSHLAILGLMLPVSMVIAHAVGAARGVGTRIVLGGVIVAVFATLTLVAERRTEIWSNSETLFLDALQENPDCLPAHVNLTFWYTSHKDFARAIHHGERAVEIAPDGIPGRKNLAYAYINQGKQREAIHVLRPLAEHKVEDPDVWRALADCFEALGDTNNAELARKSERALEGKF